MIVLLTEPSRSPHPRQTVMLDNAHRYLVVADQLPHQRIQHSSLPAFSIVPFPVRRRQLLTSGLVSCTHLSEHLCACREPAVLQQDNTHHGCGLDNSVTYQSEDG